MDFPAIGIKRFTSSLDALSNGACGGACSVLFANAGWLFAVFARELALPAAGRYNVEVNGTSEVSKQSKNFGTLVGIQLGKRMVNLHGDGWCHFTSS